MKVKLNDDVLKQALVLHNQETMEQIPDIINTHNFSYRFEKKIRRINRAQKKFGGNMIMERCTRYCSKIVTFVLCLVAVNVTFVKAFDINLWQMVVTQTENFINVDFAQTENDNSKVAKGSRMMISSTPDGYKKESEYFSEELSVQHFVSDSGTISYTESLVSDTAKIKAKAEKTKTVIVGVKEVLISFGAENITAMYTDDKYCHTVEVQGTDADEEFVINIISELEARK